MKISLSDGIDASIYMLQLPKDGPKKQLRICNEASMVVKVVFELLKNDERNMYHVMN